MAAAVTRALASLHLGVAASRAIGRFTLGVARDVRGIVALLEGSMASLRELEGRGVALQAYQLANRSAFFVFVVMSFTGAIMVIQGCTQAKRILGDMSAIGPAFLQLATREFGPTIAALMVAARYGAGVGAQLGAMTITEQVDALRMTGATPEGYLVAPRIVGGLIGTLPIAILGTATAYIVGGLAARYGFGVGWDTYFKLNLVQVSDALIGSAKALAYGVAIPLVACFAGLRARGGAPGVGRATTYSVIVGSTAVLFLDLCIGTVGYLLQRAM
jgi:phospholipid/cholesterol/gamma-HCH transport system permease protein